MGTEFIISSGTSDFTITCDFDARTVRLIVQEMSDHVTGTDGVLHWPNREAPDLEALRLVVEAHFGCWIEPVCSISWLVTETEGECMQTVDFSERQPTHWIQFTDACGGWRTYLVSLDEDHAYTHAEWSNAIPPSWAVVDGTWLCEGQATPGGQNGVVEIETL